jgi:hypothetical protein
MWGRGTELQDRHTSEGLTIRCASRLFPLDGTGIYQPHKIATLGYYLRQKWVFDRWQKMNKIARYQNQSGLL